MATGRRTAGMGKGGRGATEAARERAALKMRKEAYPLMKNVLDFLDAALPWVAAGLLLALIFARGARGKAKDQSTGRDREV